MVVWLSLDMMFYPPNRQYKARRMVELSIPLDWDLEQGISRYGSDLAVVDGRRMVKKKKVKSDGGSVAPLRQLSELLVEAGLQPLDPGIDGLAKALKDEKLIGKESLRASLLCESLVVVLFSTRAGSSILPLLNESSRKKMLQKKGYSAGSTSQKAVVQTWQTNELMLVRFLSHLIENRNSRINWEDYGKPSWKLPLLFLIESKFLAASMVLDENCNLLLEYVISVTPLLKGYLQRALGSDDGNFFRETIIRYRRIFESINKSEWYTFSSTLPSVAYEQNCVSGFLSAGDDDHILSILQRFEKQENSLDGRKGNESNESVSYQHRVSQNESVYSFDLNQDGMLDIPNIMSHASLRHGILSKLLELHKSDSPILQSQFRLMAGLVDPLTQPAPNDTHIVSLDLAWQMLLGLLVPDIQASVDADTGGDWRFHLCFNMQKIIQASLKRLNSEDFETLNSINNSDEESSWRENLHKWVPHGLNTQNLELIYMVNILAVYGIYKLYDHLPIQLNPFLSLLISLWKNLTCVILLGLEIDRLEEERETFDTPILVRATIRGAAALRALVAAILNGHAESYTHDFKHEPLNTFMSPYGRKLCQGALYADLRSHAAALLALGTDLEDVTNLLADLQAGDRFDEDVRYMFEYECEEYNGEEAQLNDREERLDHETESVSKNSHRRCRCIFDDDEMDEDADVDGDNDEAFFSKHLMVQQHAQTSLAMSSNGKPRAVRSSGSFEFDYGGKDWRDIPRGINFYYALDYKFIKKPNLQTIVSLTEKGATEKLSKEESSLLLRSVASCVKKEQDSITLGNLIDPRQDGESDEKDASGDIYVDPDDIYELWCEDSIFEKLVYSNHTLAWKLMDEMLLCIGYRRVLIWFITHMELNHSLIHYIFELVMGLRGQLDNDGQHGNIMADSSTAANANEEHSSLKFSRQGTLQLSAIETKMLLQEFFTNAAIYLSKKTEEGSSGAESKGENGDDAENVSLYAVGLMKLICFMVKTFINKGKFDFTESECVFELQALLMNWIGVIPEARDLFFELKGLIGKANKNDMLSDLKSESNGAPAGLKMDEGAREDQIRNKDLEAKDFEYNKKLMKLLPPLSEGREENAAMQTLRNFIKTNSFLNSVPVIGRKVVYQDDAILPLRKSDVPMPLRDYLNDYDDNYNYVSEDEYEDI
ncbi:hypothetical protein HG536_0D05270 [Torulaspora globosa]|uniref:Uncharacterized protein n=1 Tax=Torulaspora globosa TaxID=48254 RepID=A0A7G3ZHL9_9SACH|nr:uncharacterized protein HG536_0D05270 [Torulaspora globosa]QLL33005.1 hypothetical protein HG536_0D05270 [Torulaspora globosa]